MGFTKRYIEQQMEINLLNECDVDYDYNHYDWSEHEKNESSISHYELYTNGVLIEGVDTLSDAFYVKEFIEQHEGYSNIQISRVEFPY